MAHYAFLDDDNVVTEVIVGRDEDDLVEGVTSWEDYYGALRGQTCVRTSYNSNIRFNYAGVGYTFDSSKGTDGAFIPPKPYPSWVLGDNCLWEAPVALPDDAETVSYTWDEEAGDWVAADE